MVASNARNNAFLPRNLIFANPNAAREEVNPPIINTGIATFRQRKQKLWNVLRMEMLGAKVVSVESGSNTLKDATNEAIRTWAKTAEDTFYIIGSAVGPYPYPKMVKEFQSVISREAKRQHMEAEGKNPDVVMACVGGGSNSIGMFADFIDEPEVELIGVEAAGLGIETGKHASAMALGEPGVLHGMRSYLLQDTDGNIQLAHSISAGLDYPGVLTGAPSFPLCFLS